MGRRTKEREIRTGAEAALIQSEMGTRGDSTFAKLARLETARQEALGLLDEAMVSSAPLVYVEMAREKLRKCV